MANKETLINVCYFSALSIVSFLAFYAITLQLDQKFLQTDPNYDAEINWQSERLYFNISLVFISLVFHILVHYVARCSFRYLVPGYYGIPYNTRVALSEKVLSSIHGFVLGTAGVNLVIIQRYWQTNIFSGYPPILDYIYCFSCGYELYDLGTMILQDIAVPKYNENVFWIHHSSMLIGYTLVMFKKKMAFVATVLLITELTVLPSNAHWYIKYMGGQDTRAFHFNQGLRMWSFVFLRLFTVPTIYILFAIHYQDFLNEDLIVQVAAVIISALLGFMNVNWTKTMVLLYRKRTRLVDKRKGVVKDKKN